MIPMSDLDPVQLANRTAPTRGGYLSGMYYQATIGGGLSTTATLGNGTLRVGKFPVYQRVQIAKLGIRTTVAGETGSTFRLTLFGNSLATPGYPGDLLYESVLAGDAIASPEATPTGLYLNPGLYFVGGTVQGAPTTQPTVETVSGPLPEADPMPLGTTAPTTTTQATLGYAYLGVTGVTPAAFTATKTLSSVLPRVFFKAA